MTYSDGFRVSGFYPTSMDTDRVKRVAFQEQGLLVINVDDPMLTWDQRELLKQVGEKFYGKRKAAKK